MAGPVPSDVPEGKNSALAQLVHVKSVSSFEKNRMRKVAEVMLFSKLHNGSIARCGGAGRPEVGTGTTSLGTDGATTCTSVEGN